MGGRVRPFVHRPVLEGLPKGTGRDIIEQFRSIQENLNDIRGVSDSFPPISNARTIAARVGELVRLNPGPDGQLVTIPQGTSENTGKSLRIAVVGGLLTPGVAVSIVGKKGTINGQDVLNLNSYRLVELVSCGEVGWFYST